MNFTEVLPSVKVTDIAFANHCSPDMAVPALYEIGLGVAFTDKYLSKAHSHQVAVQLTITLRKYAVSRVIGALFMKEQEQAGTSRHPGGGRILGIWSRDRKWSIQSLLSDRSSDYVDWVIIFCWSCLK